MITMKNHFFSYDVEGPIYGGFPLDMLRYGASYPSGAGDVSTIYALIAAEASGDYSSLSGFPNKRARVRLTTTQDPRGFGFAQTRKRFESFGWSVIPTDNMAELG